MYILADENISGAVVKLLRNKGHDVRWITETDGALDDPSVWDLVKAEQRFLITSDKIFAGLSMLKPEAKLLGLMLLRIPNLSANEAAERVAAVLASQQVWVGKFCIVSAEGVRIRQL